MLLFRARTCMSCNSQFDMYVKFNNTVLTAPTHVSSTHANDLLSCMWSTFQFSFVAKLSWQLSLSGLEKQLLFIYSTLISGNRSRVLNQPMEEALARITLPLATVTPPPVPPSLFPPLPIKQSQTKLTSHAILTIFPHIS